MILNVNGVNTPIKIKYTISMQLKQHMTQLYLSARNSLQNYNIDRLETKGQNKIFHEKH